MRRLLIAAAMTLLLTGCASGESAGDDDLLSRYDLAGMDTVEIIDHLDRLEGEQRPAQLMASVRPDELVLSDDRSDLSLPLPEDRFYLSIAPYVDRTHECFHHSLTTCQGELTDAEVQVTLTDSVSGEVLVDEDTTTFGNGFVGIWLPRDVAGTLAVTADGRTGEIPVSTDDDAPTCLTTLQLS